MKIYICKVSQLFQQYTGQEIYEQIPQERRRSAHACKNEADRRRSLAVSFLLGQCMRACRIPSDARIAYTKSGKLYFPDLNEFYVNLSHAGDYAVCAYDKEEIGVDVEAVRTYQERVAARLATDPEKQYFDRCTDKERDIAFSKWWTKKECAVKLTGMGIAGLVDKDKETAEIFIKEFQPYDDCFVSVASFHDCFCDEITKVIFQDDV